MRVAVGRTTSAGEWVNAPLAVGEGFARAVTWLVVLPKRWWGAWLAAPRRLSGDDPSTFVNTR